jgi:hypothetical protein
MGILSEALKNGFRFRLECGPPKLTISSARRAKLLRIHIHEKRPKRLASLVGRVHLGVTASVKQPASNLHS